MARIAVGRVVRTEGLYRLIVRAVEEHFGEWDARPPPRHYLTGELLAHPYPYQRLLDAVRVGAPANVNLYDLPEDVRLSAPMWPSGPGRLAISASTARHLSASRPARATVAPDDSVTFSDDDALRLWMEEDGFFNDYGPRPKRLRLRPAS